MKKFEPRYRLVRYGMATKVEKASRQQRTSPLRLQTLPQLWRWIWAMVHNIY
jgi:small subunit ribosomal protein S24e